MGPVMSAAANIRAIRERLRERSLSRDRNVLEDVPAITLREKRGPAESLHFPPRRSLRRLGRRPGIPILRRSARGRSAGRFRPRRAAAGSRASASLFGQARDFTAMRRRSVLTASGSVCRSSVRPPLHRFRFLYRRPEKIQPPPSALPSSRGWSASSRIRAARVLFGRKLQTG